MVGSWVFFFFKQKTAYDITSWLEFRRVLFQSLFTGLNLGLVQVKNVNYSQMDFADLGRVVIDQSHKLLLVLRPDADFFFKFASHSRYVGLIRDVAVQS